MPLLALLGLAVLLLCTLPAVRTQQRLEREHARLKREVHDAQQDVERLRRELRGGAKQSYLRIKATNDLMHKGSLYLPSRDAALKGR